MVVCHQTKTMKQIIRVPVTQQVVESIKESILNGQFPVGNRLPAEAKLCDMLHVSRSSVREAMRVLQAEGYVRLEAGKGATVADNQSHDYDTVRKWFQESAPKLEDYAEVREVLEPLCVKLAIEKSDHNEKFSDIEKIHQDFIDADKEHNVSLMAKCDEQFHSQIALRSHNSVLEKMNTLLSTELWKYRLMSISAQANGIKTISEHQAIYDAMRKHDVDAAQKAMLKHIAAVRVDIKTLF